MDQATPVDALKFQDPEWTARGERRASVDFLNLDTLWFNTGTLCNVTCRNCYIESSPRNDALVYIGLGDVIGYLDEIRDAKLGTQEIGFTGGEPFMNPDMLAILEVCLERGFRVLVLTNAMRPMQRFKDRLCKIRERYADRLVLRVSLDHYTQARHEEERGARTFAPTLEGLIWLARNGFSISVAGRTMWGEDLIREREGYARFFSAHDIPVDAFDASALVLFPEMDVTAEVPEITTACWGILGKSPGDVMCARSRMVVKRKGEKRAVVMPCTLLPYDRAFEMGHRLQKAAGAVPLNHPHCAKFCVLGGASCSA